MTTFFVGGCMRSGTTVLTAILCTDPSTNPLIAEPQYLTGMMRLYRWGKRNFPAFLEDTFSSTDEFGAFSRKWIRDYLERTSLRWSPCRNLVLKNPELTMFFADIHALISDARFLVMIRDPRDTVASIMEVARRQQEAGETTNLTQMQGKAKRLATFYNAYYRSVLSEDFARSGAPALFLKYEDLILDLERTLNKIERFSGLTVRTFDPAVEWRRTNRDYASLKSDPFFGPWITELHGKPLSDRGVGRFRERLTAEQIAVIEQECGEVFQRFGYEGAAP